jgi:hypothetical protein
MRSFEFGDRFFKSLAQAAVLLGPRVLPFKNLLNIAG